VKKVRFTGDGNSVGQTLGADFPVQICASGDNDLVYREERQKSSSKAVV
jgi:hypothetical protein